MESSLEVQACTPVPLDLHGFNPEDIDPFPFQFKEIYIAELEMRIKG